MSTSPDTAGQDSWVPRPSPVPGAPPADAPAPVASDVGPEADPTGAGPTEADRPGISPSAADLAGAGPLGSSLPEAGPLGSSSPEAGPRLGPTGRPLPAFPTPSPLEAHGPARIISVCNQKGGVGKTTSTVNLGAALAEYGRRVLLVDLDPQGALTVGVGVDPFSLGDNTIYRLLKDLSVPATDVLLKTDTAGMDLLPANIDLSVAEVELVTEIARERRLLEVLSPLLDDYDVVLIDCQPSLGLLTINALAASHSVLIPLECEYYALRGVSLLMDSVQKVKRAINPGLEIEGFLATMYDGRTLHSREVLAMLVQTFPDDVLHTVINRTIRFPESTVGGRPITSYAPSSSGAEAYRQLAREVLSR